VSTVEPLRHHTEGYVKFTVGRFQQPILFEQLGYDDAVENGTGLVATLLYNVTGPWIAQVGVRGAPDIFQQPAHQLDFNASQELGAGLKLSFKASNLLNPVQRRTQGGNETQRFQTGLSFSLGLSGSL